MYMAELTHQVNSAHRIHQVELPYHTLTAIDYLPRWRVIELLREYGRYCCPISSTSELREKLKQDMVDGTIPYDTL